MALGADIFAKSKVNMIVLILAVGFVLMTAHQTAFAKYGLLTT